MLLKRSSLAPGRGVLCTSAAVVLACLLWAPSVMGAQVLQGIVRVKDSERAVDRARLVAEDRTGRRVGEAVSSEDGRYFLPLQLRVGMPFRVTVTRIGMRPSMSDEITLALEDTVNADFWVSDLPATVAEVRTTATASLNTTRYNDARRRGWRVIDPETIALRRESAMGLNELVQSLGIPGLIVPQRPGQCIRSTRNNQCLQIILDNVLIGTNVHLNPRDVYFIAIVGASDSRIEWGDRAPYGALAIYTRMHGDVMKP